MTETTICHFCRKEVSKEKISYIDLIYECCIDCDIEKCKEQIKKYQERIKKLENAKKIKGW